ncbi:MAG: DUF1318 domain-containing protein [Verrucomicrobiota bacterium]
MKTFVLLCLAFVLLLGATVTSVHAAAADDLAAVKARMTARISSIDALKLKGALGEDNAGLLDVRDPAVKEAAAVAAEENKDRTAVYAALAKQAGSTPAQVAKTRAKQIAASSAKGVWVQDEKGVWGKK